MTPGTGGGSQCRRAELRPAEPQMLRVFARPRRLRPRRAIRDFRACARLAVSSEPPPAVFPPSERVPHSGASLRTAAARFEGGYPPLPGETALGQLSGRAVVKAVVRVSTHRDEIPAAEAPAREIIDWVDVVGNGCRLAPAVSLRFLAQRLLAKDASA